MAKFYQLNGAHGGTVFVNPERVDYIREANTYDAVNGSSVSVFIGMGDREIEVAESLDLVISVFTGADGAACFTVK